MSFDIQVISLVDDLQVLGLSEVLGAGVRTLKVEGVGGFTSASRVLVNGFSVDAFTLVDDRTLHVPLVAPLASAKLDGMDVVVVASELTGTNRTRLLFGPTKRLGRVSGLQRLTQQLVKILLTNSRSNRFRVGEGGSLVRLLGFTLTKSARDRIVASLSRAVSSTETQVLTEQSSGSSALANDERLLSLSLSDVSFSDATQEVVATLRLVTFAGSTVTLPIVL